LSISASEALLRSWIKEDDLRMRALTLAAGLNLPDHYIAAGFVRNLIWDKLHRYDHSVKLNDIDLIYFDKGHLSKKHDEKVALELNKTLPLNWSVKNQARMHIRNKDEPYHSSVDAMRYWPEIETAIGVRLNKYGLLEIETPFDLEKIFDLNITMNPFRAKPDIFEQRIREKRWTLIWPKLTIKLL
jgi:hypothetical protein